ncbi:MAG: 3-deoxy-D-manno-octulosonic acid transferase [Citrobacter freundii]|nr:MAG: 3-deoxy-D-manno-octulosonic acid transferase [Citrobacter freundii]
MELIFYNIFLFFFRIGVRIAALFNRKAGLFLSGRKELFRRLESALKGNSKIIWMHCASLGEFEQGRPVLEQLRKDHPDHKLLVTFFSPSGYEIMKNYKGADWVFYLPVDSASNAKRFLDIVDPVLVVFVKYEYWYYYFSSIRKRGIPLLMVSAIFRENSAFFKWYGRLYRTMLRCITHLFIQNKESAGLLSRVLSEDKYTIAGDTRFDRVIDIAEKGEPIPLIEEFTGDTKTIIAGSSWPADENVLQKTFSAMNGKMKLIIAPHDISNDHVSQIQSLFPGCLLYSQLLSGERKSSESDVLVINNIGLLSRVYRYAHTTYIGGAFKEGLHNILEAAVYGKPVFFGPEHRKFMEAGGLIEAGGAFSIEDEKAFTGILLRLVNDNKFYEETCIASKNFVYQSKGATAKVMNYIQEKRLLTS